MIKRGIERKEIKETKKIEKKERKHVFRRGNKLTTKLRMGQKDAV